MNRDGERSGEERPIRVRISQARAACCPGSLAVKAVEHCLFYHLSAFLPGQYLILLEKHFS